MGPESQIRYFMINAPNITKNYISLDVNVSGSLSSQSWRLVASGVLVFCKMPQRAGESRGEGLERHSRREAWTCGISGWVASRCPGSVVEPSPY